MGRCCWSATGLSRGSALALQAGSSSFVLEEHTLLQGIGEVHLERPHSCLPHGLDVVPQPRCVLPEVVTGSQSLHHGQGGLTSAGTSAGAATLSRQTPIPDAAKRAGMGVLRCLSLPEGFLSQLPHALADEVRGCRIWPAKLL
jgi:hypothetical protein